ncbi:hypothetical protein CU097_003169 [Rhizopus azygosporus]|uniref:Uncharacterized protein n=1 Tax=Rhizopus azygosporus TaxID=86630 RepID=A0A367JE39_RHIAZ|nr:hypothetical protein CU097_003169 [Rhizopus azygosporus]
MFYSVATRRRSVSSAYVPERTELAIEDVSPAGPPVGSSPPRLIYNARECQNSYSFCVMELPPSSVVDHPIHITEFNSVPSACNTDHAQLADRSLVSTDSPTSPTAPSSPPSEGSDVMFPDNVFETDSKDVNDMVDTDDIDKEMSFKTDWYQYESDNEPTYEESVVKNEQIVEPKEVKIDYTTVDDLVLQTSLKVFQYAKKKGVSREALDGIIGMVNNHMKAYCSEAPLLYSHYKSKERLTKRFPVKAKALDVCKNGCMLYDENAQIDEKCCNSKCKGNKVCAKKMMYLPLIGQLAPLVSDKEIFKLLKSPRKNEKRPNLAWATVVAKGLKKKAATPHRSFRSRSDQIKQVPEILHEDPDLATQSVVRKAASIVQQAFTPGTVVFSFLEDLFSSLQVTYHAIQGQIGALKRVKRRSMYIYFC